MKNNQCSEYPVFIFHFYLLTLTQRETGSWHSTVGINKISKQNYTFFIEDQEKIYF